MKKTIGLLGGMSWESTLNYYRVINEEVKYRLGGLHSGKIVLYSVDFAPIEALQARGAWDEAAVILTQAARGIEASGADFLLICTNTMHKIAPQIEEALTIPLVHIADATAEILVRHGIQTVGLLGTSFTMEEDFYSGRLRNPHGLEVLIPEAQDRQFMHQLIFEELCLGTLRPESRKECIRIIAQLGARGAKAVVLACTEIGMLVRQSDTPIPLYDTTILHAHKAVDLALQAD